MKKLWLITALSLGLLALTACSGESGNDAKTGGAAMAPAHETAAAPSSGSFPFMGVTELDQYLETNAGRPTMLFFWASWCPSCKQQIPELEELRKTKGDKINIVALSVDENRDALTRYMDKHPMDVPVYWGDQAVARKFRVEAIPTLVIFDKTGKQIFAQAGVFPGSMLGAMADKLNQ
ncbi:alkyl hydroperoxide reductase/ Thiol specific antioxidant/ Mal allergen [Pseudodesulfovibrio mercurii]|uniref:Alkyl hydroperoxide reductase/ Thiol specific antioxidant/ Mal allergen n=1 Tax=Pseudodesulfovibrio mercurii TaxID=641491 RepID=F0JCN7_9BACT|nr:TlpA disulfide reductase family protein [Pseudodesulfovibrio mercurii]EGB15717.1 alkyl hydroperoxide reductase/ Thiol specific antioxidant/ Mal allergen [Pseudodesulfovibrio mercurii]